MEETTVMSNVKAFVTEHKSTIIKGAAIVGGAILGAVVVGVVMSVASEEVEVVESPWNPTAEDVDGLIDEIRE